MVAKSFKINVLRGENAANTQSRMLANELTVNEKFGLRAPSFPSELLIFPHRGHNQFVSWPDAEVKSGHS